MSAGFFSASDMIVSSTANKAWRTATTALPGRLGLLRLPRFPDPQKRVFRRYQTIAGAVEAKQVWIG
jgi:hypothetical protein